VPQVVDAELKLVALLCLRVRWRNHDACVQPEHIQTRLFREKFFGGALDCGEIVEFESEEDEFTFGVWMRIP
jgi:hypothetical protein